MTHARSLCHQTVGRQQYNPTLALALTCTVPVQDSLGGNARTVLIANVSPAAGCMRESQSTLTFAQRAKQIVNKAVVNEAVHGELDSLIRENERLRRELRLLNDTCRALQQVHSCTWLEFYKIISPELAGFMCICNCTDAFHMPIVFKKCSAMHAQA